jgi:hypothetical protein
MVEDAARFVAATLAPVADRDWSVPAGEIEWSCHATADHISDALASYAANLATGILDDWAPLFRPDRWPDAAPADLLAALGSAAAVLAAVARGAPAGARAYHAFGITDAEGLCAMGCDELLVHGGDIAAAFGVAWSPPAEIASATFGRLFPAGETDPDPWTTLWHANGRAGGPARWSWHAAPLPV